MRIKLNMSSKYIILCNFEQINIHFNNFCYFFNKNSNFGHIWKIFLKYIINSCTNFILVAAHAEIRTVNMLKVTLKII